MKPLLVLTLSGCISIGLAQTNAADRTAPISPSPPSDGWFVKELRTFAPEENRPLTGKERWHNYLTDTIGPFSLIREAAAAGISQARGAPPEWGGGMAGFGRRFGDDVGFNVVHQSITYGTAEFLHEDNRYFAAKSTTTKGRIFHALISPLAAQRPDGSMGPSYSNIAGVVGASALETVWEPPSWRGGKNIARTAAYSFGGASAYNLLREFIPDLIRTIQKK